jgi:hypothetical protein
MIKIPVIPFEKPLLTHQILSNDISTLKLRIDNEIRPISRMMLVWRLLEREMVLDMYIPEFRQQKITQLFGEDE